MVSVGCQTHSSEVWRRDYQKIARTHGFPGTDIEKFLGILSNIEKFVSVSKEPSNNDILETITKTSTELQKSSVKQSDVDSLKTLVSSLKVSADVPATPTVSKGPFRDVFGKFAKKPL
jgi:hypothetical protein